MSEIKVFIRIRGDLPPEEDLTSAFQGMPFQLRRRGQRIGRARTQPIDVLLLELASWESSGRPEEQDRATRDLLLPAAAKVRQLEPALAALDRTRCLAELSISTIRHEDQGGFELPAELIAAAGLAGLSVGVSILVMLGSYSSDESTGP